MGIECQKMFLIGGLTTLDTRLTDVTCVWLFAQRSAACSGWVNVTSVEDLAPNPEDCYDCSGVCGFEGFEGM